MTVLQSYLIVKFVLELLTEKELTIQQIIKKVDMPASGVYRLIHALEDEGLVKKSGMTDHVEGSYIGRTDVYRVTNLIS